jgi:hypothetical protein
MVERLVAFKSDASVLTSAVSSLDVAKDFEYAMHDAFAIGFNKRRNKPAELIARHIDKIMRKGQGSTSEEAFNEHLDASLALYRFTADKDVFRAFYHKALARRLLLGRSASDDAEKAMLKKLKEGAYSITMMSPFVQSERAFGTRRLRPRVQHGRPHVPGPRALARLNDRIPHTPWA